MKKNVWRKIWISIGTTAALVFLIWATSTTLAQGPDDPEVSPSLPLHTPPESATAPMEPEGGPNETMKFTYQGLLEIDGHPVTGNYLFWGAMYDAKTAGVFQGYCTESGSDTAFESYVEDGVFTLYLICGGWNSDAFTGAGRWLDLWVAPAGTSNWVRLTESLQPISPTPYAFSLFPGAIINGTSFGGDFGDSVLNIYNNNTVSTWSAFRAETASGSAVRGTSDSGTGLYGSTEDSYGVYGSDGGSLQGRGYGGYFTSANGVGAYGYSGASSTYNNADAPGIYGRSYYGVGVLGYSTLDTGGKFMSYGGSNIIEGWEDFYSPSYPQMRFRVTRSGNVYADGSFTGGGADVAERIDASEPLEPGSVVEIDPSAPGRFRLSRSPFSTLVVGVISTNPAVIMNHDDPTDGEDAERTDDRPLLALVGQVPVRVTAENGPIVPGDLLVASSTPGHAMRGGDDPPTGTVVGKALEGLEDGTGVIQMLVMLQ